MENKVLVRNNRIISNFFKMNIELREDLLKRKEAQIINFIDKYKEFLFDYSYDKFREFTEYTGICFMRIYKIREDYQCIYLDELGISTGYANNYNIPVDKDHIFKHHLTIYIDIDDFLEENNCIYIIKDGIKKLIYKKNEEYEKSLENRRKIGNIIYDSNYRDLSLTEKIKLINEIDPNAFSLEIEISKIKQIECIYPFEDVLVLTDTGELFINNKLYSKNVREICVLTYYRSYIIYNNNDIEYYVNSLPDNYNIFSYKKVICDKTFIATLDKNNCFILTTLPNEYSDRYVDCENCIMIDLYNIDDFRYECDSNNDRRIILKSNNSEIILSISVFVWK